MRVFQCPNCDTMRSSNGQCCHCGGTNAVEVEMADYLPHGIKHFEDAVNDLQNRKYADALANANLAIEWLPSCADVFWIRLLATKSCSNDIELISKGFNYGDDPNFLQAVSNSDGKKKNVYLNVYRRIKVIAQYLDSLVRKQITQKKQALNLPELRAVSENNIARVRVGINRKWMELVQIEHEMQCCEQDYKLVSKEYLDTLSTATENTKTWNSSLSKVQQLSDEQLHSYHIEIGAALQMSDEAADSIKVLYNQHWNQKFQQLKTKRDELITSINSEVSNLKQIKSQMQYAISQYEVIVKLDEQLSAALKVNGFNEVRAFVGDPIFNQILEYVMKN